MTKTFESTPYDTPSDLTDSMEIAREEFIIDNTPNQGPLELEEERKAQRRKEVELNRNLALAAYAEKNIAFNGYTENID